MKLSETGFRVLYHHFCVFPMTERFRRLIEAYPGAEEANGVLVYGYIDHEAGLTMELLAAVRNDASGVCFFDANDRIRVIARTRTFSEEEFEVIEEDAMLRNRYKDKLQAVKFYEEDERICRTRDIRFLDSCRHPDFPDDISVILYKEGFVQELCWCRIEDADEEGFTGVLLNEPFRQFGYHAGMRMKFYYEKNEDGDYYCYADWNAGQWVTKDDLLNGSALKTAASAYDEESTRSALENVLMLAKYSRVWMLCLDETSDSGEERDPVFIQDDGRWFLPVFTDETEMWNCPDEYVRVRKDMLEVISIISRDNRETEGVMLNINTDRFVFSNEMINMMREN